MATVPETPTPYVQIGVGAIAAQEGKILLIRRGRSPYPGKWSIPGGKLLFGETISDAVVREMKEETGLDVKVGAYAGLLESIHDSGEWHYVIIDHFVEVVGGHLQPSDDAEDARWFTVDEVAGLDTTPMLIESLTRFGIL